MPLLGLLLYVVVLCVNLSYTDMISQSPTLSTPDSSTAGGQFRSTSNPSVNILVTSDADTMIRVDITGFRDAAFIREKIFARVSRNGHDFIIIFFLTLFQLQVSDEDQPRHSIYRTEIGQFAIGEALTDDQLFELCRDQGDATGTIKLLVSPSHAFVHEPAMEPVVTSPIVNTIVPPVLPQHGLYPPLRPKRKANSRRGSFSSAASERLPPEVNTGYEASVSDDLDHDREPRRSTIRPLPQHTGPPPRPRSPVYSRRPQSPCNTFSPDRPQMHSPEAQSARSDRTHRNALPTPPALSSSPQASRFQDPSHSPGWQNRSVADASAVLPDKSEIVDQQQWRIFQERDVNHKEKEERDRTRRREIQARRDGGLRRAKAHHEPDSEHRRREGWTVVPRNVPPSDYKKERPTTPQESRQTGSSRTHTSPQPYPLTIPPIPPQPRMDPPAPPVTSLEGRSRNKRPTNVVPPGWARGYNPDGPGKLEKTPLQTSPPPWNRMLAKSMNDLRGAFNKQGPQVPPSLQPGRSRATPTQLPLSRPATGGSTPSNNVSTVQFAASEVTSPYREPTSFSEIGLPKSYEGPRGGTHSPITTYNNVRQANPSAATGYLGLASSGQDPFPRPRSALGVDPSGSPYRPSRHLQSPSGPDFPTDSVARSPPLPPPHYYPASITSVPSGSHQEDSGYSSHMQTSSFGSRPPPHGQSHSEGPGGIEHAPHHTPHPGIRALPIPAPPAPRSPIATMTPSADSRDAERRTTEQAPITRTISTSWPVREDECSENTVRREDHNRYLNALTEQAGSSTALPNRNRTVTPPQHSTQTQSSGSVQSNTSTLVPTSSAAGSGSTLVDFPAQSDQDSDGDGTLWIVKPKISGNGNQPPWQDSIPPPPPLKSSENHRPVLAPISTDNSPSSNNTALPEPSYREYPRGTPSNFPAPPNYIPDPPRMARKQATVPGTSKRLQDQRTSRFDNNFDYTWAPRPPVEEVVERLQEYFPEHDVDKPVIEASSGGASPTSAEHPTLMPQPGKRFGHKKSIRYVAAEHKRRVDRSSRMEPANVQTSLRKRNTKLWGSRVEEVTSDQARDDMPSMTSETSPGGAKPIFRWVRGELIGKGTYGKVYLALNATTGEMIAVKQVEIPRTDSDKNDSRQVTVVEALKLESETLKDLDHPNIVQYLGFEETPTFLSIFLEYVPGGSIASCLRKHGKFDEEVTKSFTGQILAGLEYLHSKGILHRDLKADNILVETSGICKISDFGISKRTDDINMAGIHTSMQGTVFWMAPEVINSQKGGYNSKIDIWSVGCVVFEMWTGQRPWSGQEAMAVLLQLYQTRQGPPVPPNAHLSPLADDFRQKCFAMDPDERPTAAELQKHPYLVLQPDWTFNGFK
ncbi:unnamed protein product [Somion occarium]|uniref:Protein kinase domain-containing protein n=1 Tax=Somion occarium TaxID=3059160 RepID=A0ABP1CKK9_9APHY